MFFARNRLSECELLTMKCVWSAQGQPVTCAQVIEKLKEKYGLSYMDTTVYTFLSKLKGKGFVESTITGKKRTLYVPIVSEEEYRLEQLKKFSEIWYEGTDASIIQDLAVLNEKNKKNNYF